MRLILRQPPPGFTTAPITSPQSQGQVGIDGGQLLNVQVDAARANFTPTAVPYQNVALQFPIQWTIAEGTGVAVVNATAPDSTQNAGQVTCTANGPDGICGVYAYSGSETFAAGDYIVAEVWARAVNYSTGTYLGFQGTMKLSGPPLSDTFYSSNSGNPNRADTFPLDDGSWQRIYLWVKVAGGGTYQTSLRLDFTPTQPMLFYAPAIYFFPGHQLPPPGAPTLQSAAGGTLSATTYYARLTYVGGPGETTVSSESFVAASANTLISVPSPSAVTGATGWNVYVGNTATCPGAGQGALTGPGQTCELKQNSSPIPIGGVWNEPASGLVSPALVYVGAAGPAGQTEPTNDTTNAYGDSEISDFALNTENTPANLPAVPTVATMPGLNLAFGGSGDNYFATLDHSNFTANRTFQFPNASGTVALTNLTQNWTAPQTFDSVSVDSATIDGQTLNSVPIALYSAFLPGPLNGQYIAATFTPPSGIVVTRIEVALKTGPQTCFQNAVVGISGSNTWDVILASPTSDSGPISLSLNGGTPVQLLLETPAQGCVVLPQDANVEVQYRMQ